jgi:long-chain acyl-CoA synthetase
MYFFDRNTQFMDRTLLADDNGRTISYGAWYKHAAILKKIMRPRSLAVILCHNSLGSVLAYLCCLQNRIVPLLLDSHTDCELLTRLLDLYEPAYIFKDISDERKRPAYKLENYGLYKRSERQIDLYPDLALLLSTSGSTGSPKLVRQSYENIQSNAVSIASYLELNDRQRPVLSLPMHYTFGLSVINSHLVSGAAIYLTETTVFEADFWKFCQEKEITSFAGVPFTYECLKKISFFKMDLPAMTLLLQAGGKLSHALQKEYANFAHVAHKRFVVMYGQTEATARMSYLPVPYSISKIGSIGIAIPGGKFRIMQNAHTEIAKPWIHGELCYEGPNVTLGYAGCTQDLGHGDERHGCLWTGDIAYRDLDGFYYIAGRKTRFVKIMGKRINLDEVEQLFKNTYMRYDFVCTGKDDNLRVFTTAPAEELETLSDFLIQKMNLHPAVFKLTTIAVIPKNSSGKIEYRRLQLT